MPGTNTIIKGDAAKAGSQLICDLARVYTRLMTLMGTELSESDEPKEQAIIKQFQKRAEKMSLECNHMLLDTQRYVIGEEE